MKDLNVNTRVYDPKSRRIYMESVPLTENIAMKMLHKWVRRLHLEEWQIKFKWCVREKDMDQSSCLGLTTYNKVSRLAMIQMLDPVDHLEKDFPFDYEKTLVHELLHLVFADLDDTGDQLRDDLTHRMVDQIARVLIDTERESCLEDDVC